MRVVAASGVVVRDDGAVLLVRRGTPPLAGSWSLPGGKVRPGEQVEAAAVREVREEAGILVTSHGVIDVVTLDGEGFSYEIHATLCTLAAGTDPRLRAGDDAQEARWASEAELGAFGVTEVVSGIIERGRRALLHASAGSAK